MPKIVLAGVSVYGLDNLSDDSMLFAFTSELHNKIPNLELVLLARHPNKEFDTKFNFRSIKNLDHNSKQESIGRWFMGLNPNDSTDHLNKIWLEIKSSDMLIIGGEPFIDITIGTFKGLSPYAAMLVTIAKFLQKPIVIFGIHIGRKLETELGKELAKFCISNADLVTIRDEESRSAIISLGVENTNHIKTCSDMAYAITPSKKSDGEELLASLNLSVNKEKLFGITFRHMYWKWKKSEWDDISQRIAEFADYIIEKNNAQLLFIPHSYYDMDHFYESDINSHKEIIEKMKNRSSVLFVQKKLSIEESHSLFPLLDGMFSNRRHSTIFCAINNVPCLAMGEELHCKPILSQLGIDENYFIDEFNFEIEHMKQMFEKFMNEREYILKNIKSNLPELRLKALKNVGFISELMKTI